MPIYEYECTKCGHVFEEWQNSFSEKEMTCPMCQGQAKRIISNTSFILKGSGWYVTDYASKNKPTSSSTNKQGETKPKACSTAKSAAA